MNPFEELLRWMTTHLGQTALGVFIFVSILRAIVRGATQDPRVRGPGVPRPPRAPDDDLQERVRRGFEEMMRQRAGPRGVSPPSRPPAMPGTRAAPRAPAPAPTIRAPVRTAMAPVRPAPSRTPAATTTRAAPPPAPVRSIPRSPPRVAAIARVQLAARGEERRPTLARRALTNRADVRRAVLLQEILDLPISVRGPISLRDDR